MKKRLKAVALGGLVAAVTVGGTFAYYTATQTFDNELTTTKFGTSTTEKFNPGQGSKWQAGAFVDKEVSATNTGEGDVWVRVKFDETWRRKDAEGEYPTFNAGDIRNGIHYDQTLDQSRFASLAGSDRFTIVTDGKEQDYLGWSSKNPKFFVDAPTGEEKPKANTNGGSNQTDSGIGSANRLDGDKDGITYADTGSVVFKNIVNTGGANEIRDGKGVWYYNPSDGYYYYSITLASKETTPVLLDGITLCSDADQGRFNDGSYYIVLKNGETYSDVQYDENGMPVFNPDKVQDSDELGVWHRGTIDEESIKTKYGSSYDVNELSVYTYKDNDLSDDQGYSNADYDLFITVEYIQTTEDGQELAADWGWHPGLDAVE